MGRLPKQGPERPASVSAPPGFPPPLCPRSRAKVRVLINCGHLAVDFRPKHPSTMTVTLSKLTIKGEIVAHLPLSSLPSRQSDAGVAMTDVKPKFLVPSAGTSRSRSGESSGRDDWYSRGYKDGRVASPSAPFPPSPRTRPCPSYARATPRSRLSPAASCVRPASTRSSDS